MISHAVKYIIDTSALSDSQVDAINKTRSSLSFDKAEILAEMGPIKESSLIRKE